MSQSCEDFSDAIACCQCLMKLLNDWGDGTWQQSPAVQRWKRDRYAFSLDDYRDLYRELQKQKREILSYCPIGAIRQDSKTS